MLHKIVDGKEIILSEEEELALKQEWNQNEATNYALEKYNSALEYLAKTDYLAIRAASEGYTLDEITKLAREEARKNIREYKKGI